MGDPPGEFITKAIAGAFLSANSFSINFSRLLIESPEPVKPD